MNKNLKPIPSFESEADERRFWEDENNDSFEYVDWDKAKRVRFPNLKLSKEVEPALVVNAADD